MLRIRLTPTLAGCLAFGLMALTTIFAVPAFAQPSGYLELDDPANIKSDGGIDWANSGAYSFNALTGVVSLAGTGGLFNGGVYNGPTTPPTAPNLTSVDTSIVDWMFLVDPLDVDTTACGPGDPTTYTGQGGEKNGQLFSGMTYNTSSVPPKDEISNVYGIARERPDGDIEVFFGAERVVNNGDSHIDFEFLHDSVTKTGTCQGHFEGDRSQGDILLAVDFEVGGSLGTTKIYMWHCEDEADTQPDDGTVCNPPAHGPSVPHYQEVTNSGAFIFGVNSGGDIGCGGWVCREADGDRTAIVPTNDFMEGGLNLAELGVTGCFNTFLPHTRTAQAEKQEPLTASLKDFGGPQEFDTCRPPEIVTTSDPSGTANLPGISASDHVVVSGSAGTAEGTVTFFLCGPADVGDGGCEGDAGDQIGEPVILADGEADSADSDPLTEEGKYCWRAEYEPAEGSRYEPASHTNAATGGENPECFEIHKLNPAIVTDADPAGEGLLPGTSVTDTVTVSGSGPTPTGSVEFWLCGPADTDGTGCPNDDGDLVSTEDLVGGTATSDSTTNTNDEGTYCWRVVYSGDDIYNGGAHTNAQTSGDHPECFVVVKLDSGISTLSEPNADNVVPGTAARDIATITGNGDQPPTGTVKFFLCGPGDPTSEGCGGESGVQIGRPVQVSFDADGGEYRAVSDWTTGTLGIGTYCWRAEYSGNTLYNPSAHTNATTECFATVKQPVDVTPLSSPTGGNVVPGTLPSDTATIAGTPGHAPTGTVTFFLCGPADVTTGGCEGEAGDQIAGPAQVSGDAETGIGTAVPAMGSRAGELTQAIGTYCWRAEYSGDGFYLAGTHTNATTECFTTVKQATSITTVQVPASGTVGTVLHDTAQVSGGLNPTGSVTFRLYPPGDATCSGTPTFTDTVAVASNGSASSGSTTATSAGTYRWVAEYSGDAKNLGSISGCQEEPVSIVVVLKRRLARTGLGLQVPFGVAVGLLLLGAVMARLPVRTGDEED